MDPALQFSPRPAERTDEDRRFIESCIRALPWNYWLAKGTALRCTRRAACSQLVNLLVLKQIRPVKHAATVRSVNHEHEPFRLTKNALAQTLAQPRSFKRNLLPTFA